MKDKKEIKKLYDKLSEENKNVINMVAQGMMIAQNNKENEKHIPRID